MTSKPASALALALPFLCTAVTADCTPGSIGKAVRPSDPTAWEATGDSSGTCRVVSDFGEPLIVDWEAHQRGNLEEAMNDGVAVVAYDCHSLRLLRGCRIDGTYGFMAFSKKEENIRFDNSDEVGANLPGFGLPLLQRLQGDLKADSTLDLAMILVGKKRTTVHAARTETLLGGAACNGATHFVRGAFVGAFALGVGTKGAVNLGVGLFSAASRSAKLASYKDGDPTSCAQVAQGGSAPDACDALLRLELVALGASAGPEASAPPAPTCAQGLVLTGGKCAVASGDLPHECSGGDLADCSAQCAKHDAASCVRLGFMYLRGEGVGKDGARGAGAFKQACDAGRASGCLNLGVLYDPESEVDAADAGVTKDETTAAALYKQGCDAGVPAACSYLGSKYYYGHGVERDLNIAARVTKQGCDGGFAVACSNLGVMYNKGVGVARDDARAAALYKMACDGSAPEGCSHLGAMYEAGWGVTADQATAVRLYRAGCQGGNKWGCDQLQRLGESPKP